MMEINGYCHVSFTILRNSEFIEAAINAKAQVYLQDHLRKQKGFDLVQAKENYKKFHNEKVLLKFIINKYFSSKPK